MVHQWQGYTNSIYTDINNADGTFNSEIIQQLAIIATSDHAHACI